MSDDGKPANSRQVGGSHYKRKDGGEEHWDRVARLGLDYFQAQVTKYVERCWLKNGIEDLKKARHFLDKYIELKEAEAADKAEVHLEGWDRDIDPREVEAGVVLDPQLGRIGLDPQTLQPAVIHYGSGTARRPICGASTAPLGLIDDWAHVTCPYCKTFRPKEESR